MSRTFKSFLLEENSIDKIKSSLINLGISEEQFNQLDRDLDDAIQYGFYNNLYQCLSTAKFLYRGSISERIALIKDSKFAFIKKQKSTPRKSVTGNQLVNNLWAEFKLPNRSTAIFSTTNYDHATAFSFNPSPIIPKDGTPVYFCKNDINLGYSKILTKVFGKRIGETEEDSQLGDLGRVIGSQMDFGEYLVTNAIEKLEDFDNEEDGKRFKQLQSYNRTYNSHLKKVSYFLKNHSTDINEFISSLESIVAILKNIPEIEASTLQRKMNLFYVFSKNGVLNTFEKIFSEIEKQIQTSSDLSAIVLDDYDECWWSGDSLVLDYELFANKRSGDIFSKLIAKLLKLKNELK